MMKRPLLAAGCLVLAAMLTTSCTKNNNPSPANKNPIQGLWVGSYFLTGLPATDSFYYQFDIRADSTIYAIGSGTNGTAGYSSGPWSLKGTTFTATLNSLNGTPVENVQTVTATYDSVSGRLYNGVWTDISGADVGSGTFSLMRIE